MPPLIKVKLVLNKKTEVLGVYDSGSNVSLINSKLLKINDKNKSNSNNSNLKTINGVKKASGIVTLNAKIFNIERQINVFVIDKSNFDYDFLIGLDCIKNFHLIQDENLEINQKVPEDDIISKKIVKENSEEQFASKKIQNKKPTPKDIKDSKTNKKCKENEQNMVEDKFLINFNENIENKNFDIQINHLNCSQQSKIDKLIQKNKSIFARDKYDIGKISDYEAHIDLLEGKYCSKRPYRCTIEDRKEIEQQVTKLLDRKLIEESYSPFAAPVTLAFKRDENKKSRLCIDFRDLNKIVVPRSQPFPLIEDLVEKTRDCKFFSTLDINSAFWSIPLRITDRHKTAFVTQEGHFQWTCLPFGLKTSPAIFQRIMCNIIRKHKLSDFTVSYIDDILIFSKTFSEHIEHLSKLFEAIKIEGFRLKFMKCRFAADSVKYLGHMIQENSVRPIKDNLISIKNFPIPKTQKNVRQFLGKINFYHKYVPNIAITLDPLHNLLRKGQVFNWTKECQEAFDKLKEVLCTQPVLTIFDPDLPIHIYTDASLLGVAGVFKQPQKNKEEKPVAYFSKKLNQAQKKRKAIYLECLAIKESVKYWQHKLIGRRFTVFSDHKPLEKMNIKSRTDEELGDLTYYLSQYDFEIKYSPGKYNLEADCLSRNPVLEPGENMDEQLKIVNFIKLEDILKDQENNPDIQKDKRHLIVKHNVYYKKVRKKNKIILSENFSIKFIENMHKNLCHIGIKQMQKMIGPFYTTKNVTQNIKNVCKNCTICIKNKTRGQKKFGLMSHLGPPRKPFEIMSIDTIGGFGGSRSTKKYMHLLVDHFTRYAYILTSKTQNATDFIKLVNKSAETEQINTILSDQYPGINSREFKEFLDERRTQLIFTAVNSPFSNGLNERLNQTLVNKIRCKINERNKKVAWTTIAQDCVQKYNDTEHSVTKYAPSYLVNGTNVTMLPSELKQDNSEQTWIEDRKIALENTKKNHEYNKRIYDKGREHFDFKVGELVFVENGNKLNRKKLEELKIGPYEIMGKLSNTIYKINTGHRKSESNLFHISKLTPVPTPHEEKEDTDGGH